MKWINTAPMKTKQEEKNTWMNVTVGLITITRDALRATRKILAAPMPLLLGTSN